MNSWNGIGRTTRDIELKYNGDMAIGKFTVAIDDGWGEKKTTSFIPVVCFGKTAENCEKYLHKGKLCGVTGRIKTGKYENKEGITVYTTDVIADRVEFLEWGEKTGSKDKDIPEGFALIDDDSDMIPF